MLNNCNAIITFFTSTLGVCFQGPCLMTQNTDRCIILYFYEIFASFQVPAFVQEEALYYSEMTGLGGMLNLVLYQQH